MEENKFTTSWSGTMKVKFIDPSLKIWFYEQKRKENKLKLALAQKNAAFFMQLSTSTAELPSKQIRLSIKNIRSATRSLKKAKRQKHKTK